MRKFLEKLIARKKTEYKVMEARFDAAKEEAEIRQLGDTLQTLKDEIADAEDAGEDELVEELEDYLEQLQEKMQVKRIGKWVVMGTEDAIDAFKG